MKNSIKRLTIWWANCRRERGRKLFERMCVDSKTGVGQMLQSRAMDMAFVMVMRWLDNKRIGHCVVCPSTETLVNLGERYWCKVHALDAEAALARKKQEEEFAKQTKKVSA